MSTPAACSHAERATDPWFPASITKLMTAYVALDMVRTNRQPRMDQLLTVTERAAALPPSKMAFKARDADPPRQRPEDPDGQIGQRRCRDLAENLGGSIEGFADMMNATARRLGMRESHFVNPHGLPDERQQTSARDMAILARALLSEFPEQADLFDIGAIQFGTARHAQPQRAHRTLSRRRRHEDGLHLRLRLQRRGERERGTAAG